MAKKRKIDSWEIKYRCVGELGEGGNACVYKVQNKDTQKLYALKKLVTGGEEKKKRFEDEISVMSSIGTDIEGIIPIFEYSKEEHWYIMPIAIPIMQHIDIVEAQYENIVKDVIELGRTLEKLHERGIAHRDIKPSNIYYYKGKFCFGDFGLVDFPDNPHEFTRSDKGLGAIFTIAPEMKRDPKNADGIKADVFSMAKTLWMMLVNDEKGFDGTYNFRDASISLSQRDKYKGVHLSELEELLTKATDNNPNNRPTISAFCFELEKWLEIVSDFNKRQDSGWNSLSKNLFGEYPPALTVWEDIDTIISVLNIIGAIPTYNHMMLSSRGGLDFEKAEKATEPGCIYIYDTLNQCFVVSPKSLRYESFKDFRWNYFLLEFNDLVPVFEVNENNEQEIVVEDIPGHYVSAKDAQYGVYDYDTGEKLPEGYKIVRRYLKGKFLIVLKNGPYNMMNATYDGRHGMCSNDLFRKYINGLSSLLVKFKEEGYDEYSVLNNHKVSKNPFLLDENIPEKDQQQIKEDASEYIYANYQSWCFENAVERIKTSNSIRYRIDFNGEKYWGLNSFGLETFALCLNGYIQEINESNADEICFFYDKEEAKNAYKYCGNLLKEEAEKRNLEIPSYRLYFSIVLERCGKPTHLFTKDEIESLIKNADDRADNMLVIDENGFAQIIQALGESLFYPVIHETWQAGNRYVGKYADISDIDEIYLSTLNGWLNYLETNRQVAVDYYEYNLQEHEIINKIRKYMILEE